jgi:hypothetical protein
LSGSKNLFKRAAFVSTIPPTSLRREEWPRKGKSPCYLTKLRLKLSLRWSSIRETEAESVAYVVCSSIGLETGTAAQDYLGLYGGDSKLLLESLEYVQATASRILDAIEERPQQQAA